MARTRSGTAAQQSGRIRGRAADALSRASDWVRNGSGGRALANSRNNTNSGDVGKSGGKS